MICMEELMRRRAELERLRDDARLQLDAARGDADKTRAREDFIVWRRQARRVEKLIYKAEELERDRQWRRQLDLEEQRQTPQLVIIRESSHKPTPPSKRFFPKPWCG